MCTARLRLSFQSSYPTTDVLSLFLGRQPCLLNSTRPGGDFVITLHICFIQIHIKMEQETGLGSCSFVLVPGFLLSSYFSSLHALPGGTGQSCLLILLVGNDVDDFHLPLPNS